MSDLRSDNTASTNAIHTMRLVRGKRGLSQYKLSDLLVAHGQHISRDTLANQERGNVHQIPVDQVGALAVVLGVPFEMFLRKPCETCENLPPVGFTCNDCGATGVRAEAS